ncbi:MAG: endo-1,4-beta-xylanase [Prevotella sp.]|nr:endo-1,4-beta-xylanase [Prevotella sp.]
MKRILLASACYLLTIGAQAQTLKDAYRDYWRMGVATTEWQDRGEKPEETALIVKHFNSVTAENCMKCEVVHPQEHVFDFTQADQFVDNALANNQFVIGHCLIWHSQCAPWFFIDEQGNDVKPEVLRKRMKEHIFTIMNHFRGRVGGWDVLNEAIEDDGTFRKSGFYRILGEDYIRLAFQYAHEADPTVELYIQDYNMAKAEKRNAYTKLVRQMRNEGFQIDAIGIQGHLMLDSSPASEYEKSIEAFASTGAKVMVTELECSALPNPYAPGNGGANISDRFAYRPEMDPYRDGLPKDIEQKWEQRYLDLFKVLINHRDVITRVTIWGLTDDNTWRNDAPIKGRKDYPLLFDRNNQPKPLVQKLIDLVQPQQAVSKKKKK